jgi:putative transcriptional regulator
LKAGPVEGDVRWGSRAGSARRSGLKELARGFRPKVLTALRKRLGLSQAELARQFTLNLRTLRDWEQGRREPEDVARAYLRVIERNPDAVRAALED